MSVIQLKVIRLSGAITTAARLTKRVLEKEFNGEEIEWSHQNIKTVITAERARTIWFSGLILIQKSPDSMSRMVHVRVDLEVINDHWQSTEARIQHHAADGSDVRDKTYFTPKILAITTLRADKSDPVWEDTLEPVISHFPVGFNEEEEKKELKKRS